MPLYEYQCPRCGAMKDVRIALADLKDTIIFCSDSKCGTKMRRVFSKPNIILRWKQESTTPKL